MHYTSTLDSYAEFTFEGSQFALTFTKYINRGSIDVYIDGVYADTIDANGTLAWQSTWTSADLGDGTYTVRFVHAGGGDYIDIDAIQIFGPPVPVGIGTYDDTDPAWRYSSGWSVYTGGGPYNNTMHYTNALDSYAEFTFAGSQFALTFTKYTNRGSIEVYIDGVYEDTIDANGALAWQSSWTSRDLGDGTYTVRFVHASGGDYVDIDAIQILP
jgi:hypothetical protein